MRRTAFDLPTREAAEALALSVRTLKNLRNAGVLKPGVHYIATGMGVRATRLRWNIEKCEEALAARTKAFAIGTGKAV